MSTSPQTPDCVPPAEEEFVTMSKQQFDDLCRKINPEACGDSLPSTSYSTSVPAPSAKPSFLKPGLEKQFDFNQELYSLVVSGIRHLPEGFPVPPQFMKASTLALQSNELLAAADKDPGIWEFYDQQCKAESFKYNNPILAKYFQEKKKEEKKTSSVGASAKRQFRPYPARAQQPFRFGGATWVLASPPSYPDQTRPSFQKNPGSDFHMSLSLKRHRSSTPIDRCVGPHTLPGRRCKGRMMRFTFDTKLGRCVKVMYGGCRKTSNNFYTLGECRRACMGK